jgi:RHS repeat-associated protein
MRRLLLLVLSAVEPVAAHDRVRARAITEMPSAIASAGHKTVCGRSCRGALLVPLVAGVLFALSFAPAALADGTIAMDGTVVAVSFTSGGQVQTYTFNNASQPQNVSLQVTSSTLAAASLVVKDPNGTTVKSSGTFGSSYFSDTFTLTATGQYSIVITAGATSTGSMNVQLFAVSDVIGTLPGDGTWKTITITTPGQNANLTFEGTAGNSAFLRLENEGNNNVCGWTALNFQMPSGQWLFHNEVGNPAPHWEYEGNIDRFVLPESGTYKFVFDPDSFVCTSWTGTTQVALWANLPPDVQGTIPSNGTQITSTITTPGQNASFGFEASGGEKIYVSTGGVPCGWTAVGVLFAPDQSVVTSLWQNAGDINRVTLPSQSGTYSVYVNPAQICNAWTGNFSLRLWFIPADATGEVTIDGATVNLAVTTPGQWAVPTFHAPALQPLQLCVGAPFDNWDAFYVFDPAGNLVTSWWGLNASYPAGCKSFASDQIPGTYTIRLDPGWATTGTAHFTLTSLGPPGSALWGLLDLHGPNPSAQISEPVNTLNGFFSARETDLNLPGPGVPLSFSRSYSSIGNGIVATGVFDTNAYAARTLALAPIQYWRLGDSPGSTTAVDSGSAPQTLTYSNATLGVGGAVAEGDTAVGFDSASNSYARNDSVPSAPKSNLTMEAWVYPTAASNGTIISQSGNGWNGYALTIGGSGGCNSGLIVDVAVSNVTCSVFGTTNASGRTLPLNQWSFVAATRTTSTWSLYVNGNLVGTSTSYAPYAPCNANSSQSTCASNLSTVSVGSRTHYTGTTTPFAGRLDEVAFFNTALSVDQIQSQLYRPATAMGTGWIYDYDVRLLPVNNGDQILRAEGGQQLYYILRPDGSYRATGASSTLTSISGGWKLTREDQVVYTFNSGGRLTSEVDRNGLGLSFSYDGNGNLSQIADAVGRTATLAYTGGLLTSVTLSDGRSVSYGYTNGLLTSVTDARGKVWTYAYDSGNRLASEKRPDDSFNFRNTYDPTTGRATQTLDALDNATTYGWNSSTSTATTTDPAGKTVQDIYANNKLSKRIADDGDTNTYVFNSGNYVTSFTDGRGKVTTMSYDSAGHMLTRTGPAPSSVTETWTYDSFGDVLTYKDGRGTTTSYGYDAGGNLSSVTKPGGLTTTYTRDSSTPDLVTAISDPRNKTTSFGYDPTTKLLTSVTTPLGNKTTYGYDAAGRVTSVTEPRGNVAGCNCAAQYTTTYTYSGDGKVTSVTDLLAHQTSYGYDDNGRLHTVTNDQTKTWTYDYNPANEKIKETAPDLSFKTWDYDSRGNLIKQTSASGAVTTYGYDDESRLVSKVTPRGNVSGCGCASQFTWTYGYDGNGNKTSQTDPLSNTTNYTYDELSRLSSVIALGNSSNYGSQVSALNPAGYWRLGEASGTTAGDATANGRNGSYTASPTLGVAGAIPANTAVNFNGTNQYVQIPYAAALNSSTFTVSAWVYLTGGQGAFRSVVTSRNFTTVGSGYALYASDTNQWQLRLGNGTGSWVTLNGPSVVLNRWTQVTASYDGTTARLYVDGVLAGSTNLSYAVNTSKSMRIAAGATETSATYFLPGKVDEVAVFASALSSNQINSLLQEQQRGMRSSSYVYDANDNLVSTTDMLGNVNGSTFDALNRQTSQISFGVAPADYWRFDESTGATSATDIGASAKPLTYSSATLAAGGATSDGDGAVSFTGASPSRATTSTLTKVTTSFTMTAWVYPTSSSQRGTIFYIGDINTNGYGLMMMGASGAAGNTLRLMTGGSSWDVLNNAASRTLPTNQWTFAAITRDLSGNWSLYMNGNPTAVATGTANPSVPAGTSTAGTWIGGATGSGGTNYYLAGRIDEPAFYTSALTGTQLQQIHQQAGALHRVSSFGYDNDGNRTKSVDPLGNATTYSYDDDNRLTSIVDPLGNVSGGNPSQHTIAYGYDPAGHRTSVTDQSGHQTQYTFNRAGLLSSVTDANNHTTSYGYDSVNRLVSVVDPLGNIAGCNCAADHTTSYGYDQVNNLTSRTDAKGHVTTYGYDDDQRATTVQTQLGNEWTYSYDNAGNLKTKIDAKAHASGNNALGTTTYSYDNDERLIGIDYSDSTPDVSYSYDGFGNRLGMSDGAGTASYDYDALDRLVSLSRGSDAFNYNYDPFGDVSSRTLPGGTVVNYGYDGNGRITSATSGGNATSYTYDEASQLKTTTLPNGYVETRNHANNGWLTSLTNVKSGTTLSSFAYTRDDVGNPTQIETQAGTERYTYDPDNRLTEACYQASACSGSSDPFIRYSYDAVGNRLGEDKPTSSTNYTYNGDDQLTSVTTGSGTTNYSYDANDQQISRGSDTFSWNVAGRLTSASVGGTASTYASDGDGNRLSATVGSATTSYLWDTNYELPQLALERDGSNSLIRRYLYGLSLISMTTPDNDFYYLHDGQSNTANLTSTTGATEWTYSFEPFGNTRNATQNDPSAPANPLRFAGEYLDGNTTLYNLRARQYDTTIGRFLSTDPLTPTTSAPYLSAYTYTAQNPLTATDPSGMDPCSSILGKTICRYTHRAGDIGDEIIRTGLDLLGVTDVHDCATNLLSGNFRIASRKCVKALVAVLSVALPGGAGIRLATRSELELLITREARLAAEDIGPTVGELRNARQADAHHIIQEAAVRDVPGYHTKAAPGLQLEGPSGRVGSPHYVATQVQRTAGVGGTYAAERQVAAMALRAAGYSDAEIAAALARADAYFGRLGLSPDSPLRIPGNRSVP